METLALIETLDRDGQPRQILRVSQWPVRIGRAIDCDLVLDDPHVAAHHELGVARRDVRVVEHDVAVDRAADAHRPRGDAHGLARQAVAIQQLDQGERFHANPWR